MNPRKGQQAQQRREQRRREEEEEEEEEEEVMPSQDSESESEGSESGGSGSAEGSEGSKEEDEEDGGDAHQQQQQQQDEDPEGSEEDDDEEEDDEEEDEDEEAAAAAREKEKERLKKEAKKYRDEIERRGVVYLSSLPPFMKPAKVKHLLEQFAPITRLYMVEEDQATRKRRIRAGGNRKKKYVEGWVEFADKRDAKLVAERVNGTLVGGKKRNFYHDDMWTIKYLKGFKWRHLTEKLAYERRVREQKLRVEMMQAKKENALFAQLVEKKKELEGMEARKREKRQRDGKGGAEGEEERRVVRRFRQHAPLAGEGSGATAIRDKGVLKAVFQEGKAK